MEIIEVIMRFAHLFGAIAAGYYLLFPFFAGRLGKLRESAREGYVNGLLTFNRVGQYIFILQFITGGYLISQREYSVTWMILVIVIFIAIAALAGMMSRPMKQMRDAVEKSEQFAIHLGKIRVYSSIIAIGFAVLVWLMFNPF